MVQATDRKLLVLDSIHTDQTGIAGLTYPSKNENPLLPQPEPSITVVNTHCGLCLFGVRMRRAMHMQIDAMTAIVLMSV